MDYFGFQRSLRALFFSLAACGAVHAQGFLLVRTDPAQKISYEFYEDVTINSQPRLRTPGGSIKSIDPNAYKNFGKLALSEAPVLRRTADGVLVEIKSDGGRALVLPDGLKLRGAQAVADAWKDVAITVREVKKDKNSEKPPLGLPHILAIVASTSASAGAAAFVTNPVNFDGIDEQGKALIAAAEAFRASPDAAAIVRYLSSTLRDGYSRLENGGAFTAFLETVRFAEIAAKAFPEDKELAGLSKEITGKRAWIEDTTRMLRSLYSNRAWDSFLDRYLAFEKYQGSFAELIEARRTAYDESTRFHSTVGVSLSGQKKYGDAQEELRLASLRDPDNRTLANTLEDTRMKAARAIADERAVTRKGLASDSTEAVRFGRAINRAKDYIRTRQFKEAEEQMADAADLDKDSPQLLLLQATYYEARGQLALALDYLDRYDQNAVTKAERDAGEEERNKITPKLDDLRRNNVRKLDQSIQAGNYWEAEELANQSLNSDPNYDEFLYRGGIISAVLRRKDAAQRLQDYLERSNSRRGDPKTRDKAARVLAILRARRPASNTQGKANWFSGNVLRNNVYYCPLSVAFQGRIESIQGNKKMGVSFEWAADGKLRKVSTHFDDLKAEQEYLAKAARHPGAAEAKPRPVVFGYQSGSNAVYRVAEGENAPPDPGGLPLILRDAKSVAWFWGGAPTEAWKYPVLPNHPGVDPDVVALLDGPVTVGFAGNSYFNPFVWDGVHIFRFQYDAQGRVESAREVGPPNLVRFEWNSNDQLTRVTAYDVSDNKNERPVYHRGIIYNGNDLASESIEYAGKTYRIDYQSSRGVLQSASFNDVDGSVKKVSFRP